MLTLLVLFGFCANTSGSIWAAEANLTQLLRNILPELSEQDTLRALNYSLPSRTASLVRPQVQNGHTPVILVGTYPDCDDNALTVCMANTEACHSKCGKTYFVDYKENSVYQQCIARCGKDNVNCSYDAGCIGSRRPCVWGSTDEWC